MALFDLAYPLDDTVEIDGKTYELDMAFDNILRLIDLLEDKEIDPITKINIGLKMLIDDTLDEYSIEKKDEIFYLLIKEIFKIDEEDTQPTDIDGNPMPKMPEDTKKTYDLKQDAEYIYASFMSDYGIDLFEQQGKLHWYKFKALLGGLTEGSKFLRVIEIRTMELPKGKGMEKERQRIKKLKEIYKLKDQDDAEDY